MKLIVMIALGIFGIFYYLTYPVTVTLLLIFAFWHRKIRE